MLGRRDGALPIQFPFALEHRGATIQFNGLPGSAFDISGRQQQSNEYYSPSTYSSCPQAEDPLPCAQWNGLVLNDGPPPLYLPQLLLVPVVPQMNNTSTSYVPYCCNPIPYFPQDQFGMNGIYAVECCPIQKGGEARGNIAHANANTHRASNLPRPLEYRHRHVLSDDVLNAMMRLDNGVESFRHAERGGQQLQMILSKFFARTTVRLAGTCAILGFRDEISAVRYAIDPSGVEENILMTTARKALLHAGFTSISAYRSSGVAIVKHSLGRAHSTMHPGTAHPKDDDCQRSGIEFSFEVPSPPLSLHEKAVEESQFPLAEKIKWIESSGGANTTHYRLQVYSDDVRAIDHFLHRFEAPRAVPYRKEYLQPPLIFSLDFDIVNSTAEGSPALTQLLRSYATQSAAVRWGLAFTSRWAFRSGLLKRNAMSLCSINVLWVAFLLLHHEVTFVLPSHVVQSDPLNVRYTPLAELSDSERADTPQRTMMLLMTFFRFFATEFNWATSNIDLSIPEAERRRMPAHNTCVVHPMINPMIVIDPVDPSHCLTEHVTSGTVHKFEEECGNAYASLDSGALNALLF